MTNWSILMEPISTLILVFFIFGGGLFLATLAYFWVNTIIRNVQVRRRNRRILDNAVAHFVEHYQR